MTSHSDFKITLLRFAFCLIPQTTVAIHSELLCPHFKGTIALSKATDLFERATYDQDVIEIFGQAYEKARKSLHDKGQPAIVQEIIAQRIVAAAKTGERDPDKLCETALNALGNKAVFER